MIGGIPHFVAWIAPSFVALNSVIHMDLNMINTNIPAYFICQTVILTISWSGIFYHSPILTNLTVSNMN